MKKYIFNAIACGAAVVALAGISSCQAESPFEPAGEGEGTLRMAVTVNQAVTRATVTPEKRLVQITRINNDGTSKITNQYNEQTGFPSSIRLAGGNYAAEAWAGDSVPVSLSKKFYAGYESFTITPGADAAISLNCKIRNVVVALDCNEIMKDEGLTEYSVRVSSSTGSVTFSSAATADDEATLTTPLAGHAYFMMANGDKDLVYTITGKYAGVDFTQTGKLENVEAAHQYNLRFKYGTGQGSTSGAGAVDIDVNYEENPIISGEDVNALMAPPSIAGTSGFDIANPYTYTKLAGQTFQVKVLCYGEISQLQVQMTDADRQYFNLSKMTYNLNLDDDKTKLKAVGVSCSDPQETVTAANGKEYKFKKVYITFEARWLRALPTSTEPHSMKIIATDALGQNSEASLGILCQ